MRPERAGGVDWYAMLFPRDRTPRRYRALADRWSAAVGGAVNPSPHVTVAYLVGDAEMAGVVAALRRVAVSAFPVETDGVLSFTDVPHPLFGYAASLRVVKTDALGDLHRAVVEAVRPLGLLSLYEWSGAQPHLQVLRHMPRHPREALPTLAALDPRYRFRAARLVLSHPEPAGAFPVDLARRLTSAKRPLHDPAATQARATTAIVSRDVRV